jgi:16S rRNA processing protein RimM
VNTNDFFSIGYIHRVIGLKGELGIRLDVDNPKRYKGIDAILLSDATGIELFDLKQAHLRGEELVIIIDGITDRDEAKKMVGKTAMLPLTALPELGAKQFYFHEIPGYKVIDSVHGELGIAKEMIERIMQPVLLIRRGYTEILIPITETTVQKVDRVNKELHVVTPEGLVDIYLEKKDEEE